MAMGSFASEVKPRGARDGEAMDRASKGGLLVCLPTWGKVQVATSPLP